VQILPNVYLVQGFCYGRHQNSYAVRTDDGPFLVDSGDLGDDSFPDLIEGCRRWGIELGDLTHMLITHAHFDHSSHAARLRAMGAKIVASPDTAEAMAAGDDRCIGYAVNQVFEPCETDIVVCDGEELAIDGVAVRCIAAPGHDAGLTIYEMQLGGETVWFCGDLIQIGHACETIELGWAGGPSYDKPTYVETLRRLAHMDCDTLLAGHGPPAIGFGKRLVEQAYTKAMLELR
jgi:glyoxylase-like metal-dependent hydrolase (beta-lactamase superfamily II)